MQVLGILVRTKQDKATAITYSYAEEILKVSREHGHIFIDIGEEFATRENLWRILEGIGKPKGHFIKLISFYTHGQSNSPIDNNRLPFITSEVIEKFSGWGIFCIGADIDEILGLQLIRSGANFLLAFKGRSYIPIPAQADLFNALNTGIIGILQNKFSPSSAPEHIKNLLLEICEKVNKGQYQPALLIQAYLFDWVNSLHFHGNELIEELRNINPGREKASEYQVLISKIIHNLFFPDLDEPHLEVRNQSGSSRYDLVFMNRATSGFWHDIKLSRNNSIVIFDAKNKAELTPSDADQMLRYSGDWRGRVIFIVCRQSPSHSFMTRTSDLLKEHNVCLLILSDKELEEMCVLKRQGNDPRIFIENLYRERIEKA